MSTTSVCLLFAEVEWPQKDEIAVPIPLIKRAVVLAYFFWFNGMKRQVLSDEDDDGSAMFVEAAVVEAV